jgi:predicted permease
MTLLKYARQGLRMAHNAPVQFLVILVTLAVGIGANSAMFSIVDAVLLRPLPYPDPEQVVTLTLRSNEGIPNNPVSAPDLEDWRKQTHTFSSITGTRGVNFSLLHGDTPERVRGLRVTPNILETLGVTPSLGRGFRPEEGVRGNEFVAIITHELWQSHFNGSPDVVGKPILLGRVPYTVVGVLPPMALPHAVQGPNSPQIVVPFAPLPNEFNRGLLFIRAFGRIRNGITIQAASAEMQVINRAIEAAEPSFHQNALVEITPLREWIVGKVRPMVIVLFAAVALVLLIACANVASILLGRSSLRAGELAVRTALGASRRELITQLLTESAVLSLIGSLLGLLLGWGFILMARHYAGTMLPRSSDIGMNLNVLGVTLLAGVVSSLLFGILPALKASSTHPVEAMKRQGRSSGIGSRSALRALLIAELAITLVLMVGSALAVRSFIRLSNVPPGFDPQSVIAAEIELPASDYKTVEQCATFFHNAVQRVREIPGVESVGASGRLPLLGFNQGSAYQVEGQNIPPKDWLSADVRIITPEYFHTIGIPLLAGRDYNDSDSANSPSVAIVNAEFARRYWPDQSAVGHKLQMFPETTSWREIVGVVGDVKLQTLDAPVGPAIYIVTRQNPFLNAARGLFLVMKVKGSPESIYPALRKEIQSIDQSQSISDLVIMREAVSNSLARNRLTMVLLLTFGGIALILAAVGVYGVVGLFVTSRMQEIGIRMALGASPGRVLRLILTETTIFTAIAIALGAASAFTAARFMRQLLFEISAADPLTFAITIITILATTLLAAMVPTRRAMRADPLVVLRVE